ncbi:hypothetical protein L1987_52724 [Smallanthus sonchifolius]|uniref:Uncharacterized protein n=1 Tax=Smallanthus sonchifolius TaxID=185202 RepID=A0ACB9ETL2_9ASTR|nr:hypothetical protein L1987_52724 [Smallanthus sonchifolius]
MAEAAILMTPVPDPSSRMRSRGLLLSRMRKATWYESIIEVLMFVDEKDLDHGAKIFIEKLELRPCRYNQGVVGEWNVVAVSSSSSDEERANRELGLVFVVGGGEEKRSSRVDFTHGLGVSVRSSRVDFTHGLGVSVMYLLV